MNEITNIVEKPTLLKQDIELSKLIYTIRGKQIMLDCDLAILYGYTVKRLNEQVKNNKNRFPEDFMFQMTREEVNEFAVEISDRKYKSQKQIFTPCFYRTGNLYVGDSVKW